MNKKQQDWDKYFMEIAEAVSMKSKDPSSKMGCVIVDKNKRVVSTGYNGLVQGSQESKLTLSERPMKYYFAIHSEMNALILRIKISLAAPFTIASPLVRIVSNTVFRLASNALFTKSSACIPILPTPKNP